MAELVSPTFDLSDCAASAMTVEVTFWHWYNFEDRSSSTWWDGGLVQLSSDGGANWQDVSPTPGYQGVIHPESYQGCTPDPDIGGHQGWSDDIPGDVWTQVTVDVPANMRTSNLRLRFLFGADQATQDSGWLIDDVAVVTR